MNNEIKEIFDIKELFKEWKQFLKWCYENNDKTVEIHRDKLKWTMDYITNLQEENKRLKQMVDWNDKVANKKQQRIDKAKENLKEIVITGYDYDGFNQVEDLKKLIDEFVMIANETIDTLQGSDEDE